MISKYCFALLCSAVLVSGCGITTEQRRAAENTHCVREEVRPIFMPECFPDDESLCAYTRNVRVGDEVVCLAVECNDGYHRDDTGKNACLISKVVQLDRLGAGKRPLWVVSGPFDQY